MAATALGPGHSLLLYSTDEHRGRGNRGSGSGGARSPRTSLRPETPPPAARAQPALRPGGWDVGAAHAHRQAAVGAGPSSRAPALKAVEVPPIRAGARRVLASRSASSARARLAAFRGERARLRRRRARARAPVPASGSRTRTAAAAAAAAVPVRGPESGGGL